MENEVKDTGRQPDPGMGSDSLDSPPMDHDQIESIVKKYDAESNFRDIGGITAKITGVLCIVLSLFHVYTAGFGLLNEVMHRTVHLALVLGLVFLVFPRRKLLILRTLG